MNRLLLIGLLLAAFSAGAQETDAEDAAAATEPTEAAVDTGANGDGI